MTGTKDERLHYCTEVANKDHTVKSVAQSRNELFAFKGQLFAQTWKSIPAFLPSVHMLPCDE